MTPMVLATHALALFLLRVLVLLLSSLRELAFS